MKRVLLMILILFPAAVLSARVHPIDTVDMADYRMLPFDSLDFDKFEMRTVQLDWNKEWHLTDVLRAWDRLYVVYEWYDSGVKRYVPAIEIFDEDGKHLGRLGYTFDEPPKIRRTNYVELVNEGAPDYSLTYFSVADIFWDGSEIFVADSAGRKVLCYDRDGNLVRRKHVEFPVESIVPLDNGGYLLGIGRDTPYVLPEKEVVVLDSNLSRVESLLFPRPDGEKKEYVLEPQIQNVAGGYMVNKVNSPVIYLFSRYDGHIVKEYRLGLDIRALSEYESVVPKSPVVIGDRYACGMMKRVCVMPYDEYADVQTTNFIVDREARVVYTNGFTEDFAGKWNFVRFLGYDKGEMIFKAFPLDRPYPEHDIIFMKSSL